MHYTEERPWGKFEVLLDESRYKVKRITVLPGKRLSLQSHKRRSEHWIIVQGNVVIVNNDDGKPYKSGDHIYIPVGYKHRIENMGKDNAVFMEVQIGDYFGEDDIIRYEDDFNRV